MKNQFEYQRGMTLLEVLIAVVIVAIGLLGVAGLQVSAISNNFVSYQYTQASILAQNILDKMRANSLGISSYTLAAGTTPANPGKNCRTTNCTPAELAAWDVAQWFSMIAEGTTYGNVPTGMTALLPSGKASITCVDATCTTASPRLITVYWDSDRTGLTTYGCDPTSSTDYKCFRLAYIP